MSQPPKDAPVIVLFGISRAGKDTVKEMIENSLRERPDLARFMPECIAFADPIKRAAYELFGVPIDVSYGSQAVRESTFFYGKSVRQIHQWLGTEIGREQISPNLWVERTGDYIYNNIEPHVPVVVSDGRFYNERTHLAPYLVRRGSSRPVYNVLIYRPGLEPNLAHESERQPWKMTQDWMAWLASGKSLEQDGSADRFHDVIVNDGPLAALRAKVDVTCWHLIP